MCIMYNHSIIALVCKVEAMKIVRMLRSWSISSTYMFSLRRKTIQKVDDKQNEEKRETKNVKIWICSHRFFFFLVFFCVEVNRHSFRNNIFVHQTQTCRPVVYPPTYILYANTGVHVWINNIPNSIKTYEFYKLYTHLIDYLWHAFFGCFPVNGIFKQ